MRQISLKRLFISTLAALVANLALFFIGDANGATWDVGMPITLGVGMVAGATVLPMLLGGQFVRVLGRTKPSIITLSAWLVPVLSIASAPGGLISSGDLATGLALAAMHLVIAVAWFFSINRAKN